MCFRTLNNNVPKNSETLDLPPFLHYNILLSWCRSFPINIVVAIILCFLGIVLIIEQYYSKKNKSEESQPGFSLALKLFCSIILYQKSINKAFIQVFSRSTITFQTKFPFKRPFPVNISKCPQHHLSHLDFKKFDSPIYLPQHL